MANESVSAVWLDGVQLDIYPGDISHFEEAVRQKIEDGGGWLFYDQPHVTYQLHVSPTSAVVIRQPK